MSRALLVAGALLLLALAPASAQELLRVEGEGVDQPAATVLRDVLARRSYLLLARDTLLPATARIPGDLVIVGADVRLEGSVAGSVVVLPGGEFFLRPGASVAGPVAALGGGVYISGNATVGERMELPANVASRVELREGAYIVYLTPPPAPAIVEPAGIMGAGIPSYDRVNGATLRAMGRARLYADTAAPTLTATALYYTARERFGGELSLVLRLGARHHAAIEAARHSATNDGWIRGDLVNSLAALTVRSDVRNYFEEDVLALEVAREAPTGQRTGQGFIVPRVRIAASDARSLPARDVWTLFGDEQWRLNPAIDAGRIVSGTLGAAAGWRGATSAFTGDLAVEWAPPGVADFDFALLSADLGWNMVALWRHAITVRGHFLHPVGTSAPAQRWSIVGGPGTLPTLATGQMRGDHLLFVESSYGVPLPWIVLPFVGSPSFVLRHAVGSAWTSDAATPPFDQNLGAGFAFPFLRADLYLDPSDPEDLSLNLAVSLPL